jgi:myo-inositol-1(or 4)-monophosphatase
MKDLLIRSVRDAGKLLLGFYGGIAQVTEKENHSSVVTEADLASERLVVERVSAAFPGHNVLGEESGLVHRGSEYTWVVDPLDGTSNFAAGIPWFGAMLALLRGEEPVMAAIYLPVTDQFYFAETGGPLECNGRSIAFSQEKDLSRVLCAAGVDPTPGEPERLLWQTRVLAGVASRARNLRLTNSCVDFCYTLEGKFGACLNHHCMIWDIAPACLMFRAAGGRFTDLEGRDLRLSLDPSGYRQPYAVLGGNPDLHRQMLEVIGACGPAPGAGHA